MHVGARDARRACRHKASGPKDSGPKRRRPKGRRPKGLRPKGPRRKRRRRPQIASFLHQLEPRGYNRSLVNYHNEIVPIDSASVANPRGTPDFVAAEVRSAVPFEHRMQNPATVLPLHVGAVDFASLSVKLLRTRAP